MVIQINRLTISPSNHLHSIIINHLELPNNETSRAVKILNAKKVIEHLYSNDRFSQWLGIKVLESDKGSVKLQMAIRKEMINGFGVCHGGITFAFADSALAFASNSHGRLSVLLDASMSYPAPVYEKDVLIANAKQMSLTKKIGIYSITISNQHDEIVGIFKGTVYRTSRELLDTKKFKS